MQAERRLQVLLARCIDEKTGSTRFLVLKSQKEETGDFQ